MTERKKFGVARPALVSFAACVLGTWSAGAAAATISRPSLTGVQDISAVDTAWLMTATILVLLMTLPGIALFYSGMVRRKNVLNTMASVIGIAAVVSVLWFTWGYSLAFTPGNGWIGSDQRFWFAGLDFSAVQQKVAVSHLAPHVPEAAFAMFQLAFAVITASLLVGAWVERMRFGGMLVFVGLWSLVVYSPIAHWVWEPGGWLAKMGALDFAGGTVVHVNAGLAGLVCAWMLGPRRGYGREPLEPGNLGFTMVGAALLWIGWFGFNAGSSLAADGRAALALSVTHIAACAGALGWALAEYLVRSKVTLLGLCSGLVAGLVAITPAAGFVTPRSALLMGGIAGVACYWGATRLKRMLGADDSLDVFGVHGVGGIVGALLTGVFADADIAGVPGSVSIQAISVLAVGVFTVIVTALLFWLVNALIGLRVDDEAELVGLDIALHGERANT
ncbi:ammonium transporter [Diaphorobacter sp. NR2-3-3-1]|nr:ammonium transporter [Diaphorobacter caeni]